jgi:hypothetical protein
MSKRTSRARGPARFLCAGACGGTSPKVAPSGSYASALPLARFRLGMIPSVSDGLNVLDGPLEPYGLDPVTPNEIADCVLFALTRPLHVGIDEIAIKVLVQSRGAGVVRRDDR